MKFCKWLKSLIIFIRDNNDKLTAQLQTKLNEQLQFIQNFDSENKKIEIEFVESYQKVKEAKKQVKSTKKTKQEPDEDAISEYGSEHHSDTRSEEAKQSFSSDQEKKRGRSPGPKKAKADEVVQPKDGKV